MGQAKQRGTREERIAQAKDRDLRESAERVQRAIAERARIEELRRARQHQALLNNALDQQRSVFSGPRHNMTTTRLAAGLTLAGISARLVSED